jgi:hypothetical protein
MEEGRPSASGVTRKREDEQNEGKSWVLVPLGDGPQRFWERIFCTSLTTNCAPSMASSASFFEYFSFGKINSVV